eukprot:gene3033-5949_t
MPPNLLRLLDTIIDPYFTMMVVYIPICFGVYAMNSNTSIQENYKRFDETPTTSLGYRYILVGEITVAGLLLFEAIIDTISNTSSFLSAEGCLANISILMSLLVSGITIFFSAVPNNNRYFIFAITDARLLVIIGAILSYAYHSGRGIWRCRYLYASAYAGGAGLIIEISNALDGNTEISIVSMTLQAMCTVGIIGSYFRWIHYLINERNSRKITRNEWNCTIYMALGIGIMLVQWALTEIFDYKTVADCSEEYLICVEVTITTFVVIQFIKQEFSGKNRINK